MLCKKSPRRQPCPLVFSVPKSFRAFLLRLSEILFKNFSAIRLLFFADPKIFYAVAHFFFLRAIPNFFNKKHFYRKSINDIIV